MKKLVLIILALMLAGMPCAMADEYDKAANMAPIIDSVVRAMVEAGIQGEAGYAPRDAEFFWSVMYLMGVNWSKDNPLCEMDGDSIRVPRKVMQEYATAAFLDYDDLLPLPDDTAISYDERGDAYIMPMSDMGDTKVSYADVSPGKKRILVEAVLLDGEENQLATVNFVLVDNPYADAVTDPTFLLTVKRARLSP